MVLIIAVREELHNLQSLKSIRLVRKYTDKAGRKRVVPWIMLVNCLFDFILFNIEVLCCFGLDSNLSYRVNLQCLLVLNLQTMKLNLCVVN